MSEQFPISKKRGRGFAALSPEVRREICRRGGIAAQATGKCHRYTSEEGRIAGRKGGQTMAARKQAARQNESATAAAVAGTIVQ